MSDSEELADFQKHHFERIKEIKGALNVDGYHGFLDFDDDIFLLDYWKADQGLNYLLGIAEFYSEQDDNNFDNYIHITTLDHDFYLEKDQPHITTAFMSSLRRLTRIWDSGGHPKSNPPSYYIEWAISKNHEIPWLAYAIDKGYYKPNEEKPKQKADKPLLLRERNTLLVIIAALAKEAKIDLSKPAKAGENIAHLTELIGAPVDHSTIEQKIKQIADALASRAK